MSSIDTRVVQMEFDNAAFERGIAQTMQSLKDLDATIENTGHTSRLGNIAESLGLSELSAKAQSFGNTFSTVIGGVADKFGVLGSIASGVLGSINSGIVGMALQGGMNRALNIEQARFQLQGLNTEWKDVVGSINEAVDGTAYGLDAAAKAAAQFKASGVELGEDMTTALRGISGVAAMTNSSYEDIARIFTTVSGNGRLMGEQLLQVSSRGLNAAATLKDYFQEVLGYSDVTEQAIRDMVSKGQIDFKTFAAAMNWAFGDQAKKANETFTGALSNVKAALNRIGALFYETEYDAEGNNTGRGGLETMRQVFVELIDVLNGVKRAMIPVSEVYKDFISILKDDAIGVLRLFNDILSDTVEEEGKTKKVASEFTNNLGKAFHNLADAINSVVEPFRRAWTNVFGPMDGLKGILTGVSARLVEFTDKLKLSENTIQLLQRPLEFVLSILKTMFEVVMTVAGVLADTFASAFLIARDALEIFLNMLGVIIGGPLDILGALVEEVGKTIGAFFDLIAAHAGNSPVVQTILAIAGAFAELGDAIFRHGLFGVFERIDGVFQSLSDKLHGVKDRFQEFDFVIDPLISAVEFLRGKLQKLSEVVATGFSGENPLIKFFRGAVDAIHSFFAAFREENLGNGSEMFGGVISTLSAFRDAATETGGKVVEWFRGMRDAFLDLEVGGVKVSDVLESLHRGLDIFVNLLKSVGGLLENVADSGLSTLAGLFKDLWSAIKGGASTAVDNLGKFVDVVKDLTGGSLTTVIDLFMKFRDITGSFVGGIFSGLLEGLFGVSVQTDVLSEAWDSANSAVDAAKRPFQTMADFLINVFNATLGKVIGTWEELTAAFSSSPLGQFVDTVGGVLKEMRDVLAERPLTVEEWALYLGKLGDAFTVLGSQVNPIEDVTNAIEALKSAMSGFGTDEFQGLGVLFAEQQDTPLARVINDLSKAASDFYQEIQPMLPTLEDVKDVLGKVKDFAVELGDKLGPVGEAIGKFLADKLLEAVDALKRFKDSLDEAGFSFQPLADMLVEAKDALFEFLDAFDGGKLPTMEEFVSFVERLAEAVSKLAGPAFEGAADLIGGIFAAFGLVPSNMDEVAGDAEAAADALSSLQGKSIDLSFGTTGNAKNLGGILSGIFGSGKDLGTEAAELDESTTSIGDVIQKFAERLTRLVPGLTTAAVGIMLAFGVFQNLQSSAALMKSAGGVLDSAKNAIDKVFKMADPKTAEEAKESKNTLDKIAEAVMTIAKSIAMVAAAVAVLGMIDPEALTRGAVAVGGIALGLALIAGTLGVLAAKDIVDTEKLESCADFIMKLAISIDLLVGAVIVLGAVPWDVIARGLGFLAVMLAELVAATVVITKYAKPLEHVTPIIIGYAVAIDLLVAAVVVLGLVPFNVIGTGMLMLASMITILTIFSLVIADNAKIVNQGAASVMGFAAGVLLLTAAVVILGALPWDIVAQGIGFVTGFMALIIAVSAIAQKFEAGMVTFSASIISFAAAVGILSLALLALANLTNDPAQLIASAAAIALVTVALGGAMALLSKDTAGAMAGVAFIVAFSAAIVVMTGAILALSAVPFEELIASVVAIVAPLALFIGVATAIALAGPPASTAILAFCGAVALLGVGILAAAAGIYIGVSALEKLFELVNSGQFETGINDMAESTKTAAPAIGEGFGLAIISTLGTIAAAGGQMITALLEGISAEAPKMAETGLKAVTDLMNGMALAIQENSSTFFEAVGNLLKSIGGALIDLLAGIVEQIPLVGEEAATGLRAFKDEFLTVSVEIGEESSEAVTKPMEEVPGKVDEIFGGDTMKVLEDNGVDIKSLLGNIGSDSTDEFASNFTVPDSVDASLLSTEGLLGSTGLPGMSGDVSQLMSEQFNANLDFDTPAVDATDKVAESISGTDLSPDAQAMGESGVEGFSESIAGMEDSAYEAAEKVPEAIEDGGSGAYDSGYNVGENAASGLADGIWDNFWMVDEAANALAERAADAAAARLEVQSPSRVFWRIANFAVMGFANGFADRHGLVTEAIEALSDAAVRATNVNLADSLLPDMANPTITPVVDLSNVTAAAGLIDTMLGGSPGLAAAGRTARAFASGYSQMTDARQSTVTNTYNVTLQYNAGDDASKLAQGFVEAIKIQNMLGA